MAGKNKKKNNKNNNQEPATEVKTEEPQYETEKDNTEKLESAQETATTISEPSEIKPEINAFEGGDTLETVPVEQVEQAPETKQ